MVYHMDEITVKAMAKVNLGLDVLRKRADGYHEVRMIMQSVELYDTLVFHRTKEPGIVIETDRPEIPTDERNLVWRAAQLLMNTFGVDAGLRVTLHKRIPMAAGMAGGSTDAAAVFAAFPALFDIDISQDRMMELGVKIGADVPYCIMGGTALAEGIGEKLTPLPAAPDCTLLIAKPAISVSTKYVYENLHADRLEAHPDIDGMMEAIRAQDIGQVAKRLGNVLESVTVRRYPIIEDLKSRMKSYGALNALMSGSGPTVFGIFTDAQDAGKAARLLRESGMAQQVETAGMSRGNIILRA